MVCGDRDLRKLAKCNADDTEHERHGKQPRGYTGNLQHPWSNGAGAGNEWMLTKEIVAKNIPKVEIFDRDSHFEDDILSSKQKAWMSRETLKHKERGENPRSFPKRIDRLLKICFRTDFSSRSVHFPLSFSLAFSSTSSSYLRLRNPQGLPISQQFTKK